MPKATWLWWCLAISGRWRESSKCFHKDSWIIPKSIPQTYAVNLNSNSYKSREGTSLVNTNFNQELPPISNYQANILAQKKKFDTFDDHIKGYTETVGLIIQLTWWSRRRVCFWNPTSYLHNGKWYHTIWGDVSQMFYSPIVYDPLFQ